MEQGSNQVEDEDPKFASLMKLAQTTDSQESKFRVMARESETYPDSISSSPDDPTPYDHPEIVMLTLPDGAAEEDDAVYHTPPEHHLRSSSSEEQNFVDCADLKKVRVSDECQSMRVRVTEAEVIVLDGSDSIEEAMNLGDESGEVDRVLGDVGAELCKGGSVTGNRDLGKNSGGKEDVEGNGGIETAGEESVVARSEEVVKVIEDVRMSRDGSLKSGVKSIDEIDKFRYVGGGDGEKRGKLRIGGDGDDGARKRRLLPVTIKGKEKVMGERDDVPVLNKGKEKIIEERDDVHVRSKGKEKVVEERDEVPVPSKGKEKVVGERDEVPIMINEKEKDERERDEAHEKKEKLKAALLKMVDVLEIVVGKREGEPEDFLEVAKRRGMKFPHPIWWPKEGEDW